MDINTKIEQLQFDTDINTVDNEWYPSVYPMHWHQYAEFIAIDRRSSEEVHTKVMATVSVNQKEITLREGDVLLIWPGELHEVIDNSAKALIALQFPMSLINSKKEFAVFFDLYRENCFFSYENNSELNDILLDDFKRMMNISKGKHDSFTNVRMCIVLYELFIKIATYFIDNAQAGSDDYSSGKQIDEKIKQACSYIMVHCSESLTLEDVAGYIGFSPCYFSRHFKKVTTHSFVEYLTLQRINKLQTLLVDSTKSITEAAYQAGFKSISTLNRTFSKYCGCSPSEFRRYYLHFE